MVDRIILIFFVYLVIILSSPCQITGCVLTTLPNHRLWFFQLLPGVEETAC